MVRWKHLCNEDPKSDPEKPVCLRYVTTDITLEALALRLADAPRGLLLERDELAGWFKSFDAYRKGRGGDLAHYLTMHRAGSLIVDRKTGDRATVCVPRAFLAVTGGAQPSVLKRLLTPELFEAGLAARFLLAMPPRQARRWTEAEVDPRTREAMQKVFDALWSLDCERPEGPESKPSPVSVGLSKDGKAAWIEFFEEHAAQQQDRGGELAAAWSKLEGYCARLALLVHLCTLGEWDCTDARNPVSAASVRAAVVLTRWLGREAERVYSVFRESDSQEGCRQIIDLIRQRGGTITVRELQRASRKYGTAEEAEQELERMVKAGWLEHELRPSPETGGHAVTAYKVRS
jgi:hypothetical protein